MPLTRRYSPEHPPGETCNFGMDFSYVIPVGVGIESGTLSIARGAIDANDEWIKGPVLVRGRAIYCNLTGGELGADYTLHWVATDTDGNIWPRSALCLCGYTS